MNIQSRPDSLEAKPAAMPLAGELPIRAQFYQEDRLRLLGKQMADGDTRSLEGLGAFDFQSRIRESAARILEIYRSTNAAQAKGEPITPAAQWLLDNNYLVEETIYQIKRDLPRRFYRQLPTLRLGDGTSVPRALAIAWAYVAHSDSSVSAQTFKAIVEGFQSVEPMKIGEIWALPSLLRFVLIENLRRLALRVERARKMRLVANEVADRALASADGGEREQMLSRYGAYARDTTFATQLLYRLRDGSQNAGRALEWLEGELE
jgi:cyclic beta-1,2-glucan synthetase